MRAVIRITLLLAVCVLLNSCGGRTWAPVESPAERTLKTRPAPELAPGPEVIAQKPVSHHIVSKGDTLYSIAWNYGYDYRDVAAWNSISPPYVIYPGQRIRLNFPAQDAHPQGHASLQKNTPEQDAALPLTPGPIVVKKKPDAENAVIQQTAMAEKNAPANSPQPQGAFDPFHWLWPAKGMLVKSDTPISRNGIDISGKRGQRINASAPGVVVYSGSGLLGYGRLIIVKHNDTFLSAYAHNSELLVKEGDHVNAGQNIALMGETNNGKIMLHFEIRKNGQPVDPLKYLPKQ